MIDTGRCAAEFSAFIPWAYLVLVDASQDGGVKLWRNTANELSVHRLGVTFPGDEEWVRGWEVGNNVVSIKEEDRYVGVGSVGIPKCGVGIPSLGGGAAEEASRSV